MSLLSSLLPCLKPQAEATIRSLEPGALAGGFPHLGAIWGQEWAGAGGRGFKREAGGSRA